jgi:hypothetical protein
MVFGAFLIIASRTRGIFFFSSCRFCHTKNKIKTMIPMHIRPMVDFIIPNTMQAKPIAERETPK